MVAEPTNNATTQLEDPLSYLPCSTIQEYRKGQVLFEPGRRSPYLHLVMEGCVKISRFIDDNEIVIDLCQADDFLRRWCISASKITNAPSLSKAAKS